MPCCGYCAQRGIDLQALINEDLALYPWRYHYCTKQNKEKERLQPCHINTYLSYHALVISGYPARTM